jgi:hypothetical protein
VVVVPTVDVVPERALTLAAGLPAVDVGSVVSQCDKPAGSQPGRNRERFLPRDDEVAASRIFAVRFDRTWFDGIRWSDVRADEVVEQVGREIVVNMEGSPKSSCESTSQGARSPAVVEALTLDELGLDDAA